MVRVYNKNRNHLRNDGKPVIIRWGTVSFPVPPIGEFVTIENDAVARKIVQNFEGFTLVAPQRVTTSFDTPSAEMLLAMGGGKVAHTAPQVVAMEPEVVKGEPEVVPVEELTLGEAIAQETKAIKKKG